MPPTDIKRRRKATPSWASDFAQHLELKHQAKTLGTRSDALKKRLKESFDSLRGLYTNENGSKFVDLPETIEVGGKAYKGMELRRSAGKVIFNEDKAEKILRRKEKTDASIVADAQSSYFDQDKIYRLVAEDRITEKELNAMFDQDEDSWAFWPVEGEVL